MCGVMSGCTGCEAWSAATMRSWRSIWLIIERIETPDKYTVRFTTRRPFAPFLSYLGTPHYSAIVPKDVVDKSGDLQQTAAGTGPFMLDRFVPENTVVLKRNPNYYETGMPYLDGIEYKIVPDEAARILREAVAPLKDLGVFGAAATRSRQRGGTDSTSFNEAGLPGIGAQLDPIQYQTHTWHTNLDTYERIVEEDAKNSAVVVAAGVYHLAMRDSLLPRFFKPEHASVRYT